MHGLKRIARMKERGEQEATWGGWSNCELMGRGTLKDQHMGTTPSGDAAGISRDQAKAMSHRVQELSLCAIPLKQVDEPPKEEQVQKMKSLLVNEFAVKYLESIGVTPSETNVRRVKSEIPLSHFKLKAAYKSKGGLEDMMYIEKTNPKLRGRHLWRPYAAKSMFSEVLDKKLGQSYADAQEERDAKAANPFLWADQDKGSSKTRDTAGLSQLSLHKVPRAVKPPPLSPIKRDDIATRVAVAKQLGKPPVDGLDLREGGM
eukprot:762637-Hanusia_phi.AAC.5